MIKFYVPIILALTIVIAGVFAFMPVQEASTVHTTILEGSMNLVQVSAASTIINDDFLITCPATSDGCLIKEIYLDDDDLADVGGVNPGIAIYDIDGTAGAEAAFTIAADTGVATGDGLVVALTGVANIAMGPSAELRIEMAAGGAGFPYTLTVIAEVEGNEVITVARILN